MAYTADYTEDDMTAVIFDGLVTAFIVVVNFITLIVLILIYNWFRKRVR